MQLNRDFHAPTVVDCRRSSVRKRLLILCLLLLLARGVSAQSAAGPVPALSTDAVRSGIEEAYLAKDDGKGKAGELVTSFFTTDIPIHCVVVLSTLISTTVKMDFVAVSVAGVKTESKIVTTSYLTKVGQSRVNFTGKPYDTWSSGKYRVDIFVNGQLVTSLPLDIRPASSILGGAASFNPIAKPKGTIRTRRNQ